ncbi:flagellin [Botrimarina mediterranea]|uniref:Flagellin n=1 Tax=Botrimarina mediterranea TaxID=2528022 RepID=A0A518K4L6_9BACT|nr:hypothetical protein [Botrimarina mediterranea]QDV72705.1 flagellin [Botrimarina mediterranea]QDV77277.1 flagellin [Planctomycetes bacterium K2D]
MLSVSPSAGLSTSLMHQRRRNMNQMSVSLERLSTGKRINHAKDDPAGLIAAEQLRGEITDKKALLKVSQYEQFAFWERESRLSLVQRGLNDLGGAVIESAGTLANELQRQALQQSAEATINSFNRLAPGVALGGLYELANGGAANLVDGDSLLAQQIIDDANRSTLIGRATVAADARYSDYEQRLLEDQIVIATETLSMVEDADFAAEASSLLQGQVLAQASNAALQYAQQSHAEAISELLDRIDLKR